MEIQFPPRHHWVFERDSIAFPAEAEGRTIQCLIAMEVLLSHHRARSHQQSDIESAFVTNRQAIEEEVRSALQGRDVQSVREVLITQNGIEVN